MVFRRRIQARSSFSHGLTETDPTVSLVGDRGGSAKWFEEREATLLNIGWQPKLNRSQYLGSSLVRKLESLTHEQTAGLPGASLTMNEGWGRSGEWMLC